MFQIEKIDRGISQKTITHNDGKTITIEATLVTPTKNNGLPRRRYTPVDAKQWLVDAGHKVTNCISGGRVNNFNYKDSSSSISKASWTFELEQEVVEEKPVAKKSTRTRAKAKPVSEVAVKAELPEPVEEDATEVVVEKKTTTRRRRKTTTKR